MSAKINTTSIFYYDYDVLSTLKYLDFDEGGGEITIELTAQSYTPTELALEIQTKMTAAGALTYVVTFNRNERSFTIESTTSTFDLLVQNGSSAGASVFGLIGFTGPDRTGAGTYTGSEETGDFYIPQFKLQDYIDQESNKALVDAAVNRSADGRVEVVRFGTERFYQMNIRFATNEPMDGHVIRSNPNGVSDLERFMDYIVEKKPFEFMKDFALRTNFAKVLLEQTPADNEGTSYSLVERFDVSLPGIFDTGILRLRVI